MDLLKFLESINWGELFTKFIAWTSTMGAGTLFIYMMIAKKVIKLVVNLAITLAVIAIVVWFLSAQGVLPKIF